MMRAGRPEHLAPQLPGHMGTPLSYLRVERRRPRYISDSFGDRDDHYMIRPHIRFSCKMCVERSVAEEF
jgi:hypothetical protein